MPFLIPPETHTYTIIPLLIISSCQEASRSNHSPSVGSFGEWTLVGSVSVKVRPESESRVFVKCFSGWIFPISQVYDSQRFRVKQKKFSWTVRSIHLDGIMPCFYDVHANKYPLIHGPCWLITHNYHSHLNVSSLLFYHPSCLVFTYYIMCMSV